MLGIDSHQFASSIYNGYSDRGSVVGLVGLRHVGIGVGNRDEEVVSNRDSGRDRDLR